jgi:putative peptidoglycan lipid II flippase
MITAIYQGGKFDSYDAQQTALALSCYAIGLAGYSGIKVLNPAFYALNDSRTPMLVSLASIAVNAAAATALLRYTDLGHAGLALSTSTVALFSFITLFSILRVRTGGIHGRALASSSLRIALASAGMGVVVSMVALALDRWLGGGRWPAIATLAASIPAGLLSYYGACRLLRVPELELAVGAFTGPLRRVFAGRRDSMM